MTHTQSILSIAMLSVHTSPLATLGGKKTGGMNVYVKELGKELGKQHTQVDVYTRRQDETTPAVVQVGDNVRVIQIDAGPPAPLSSTSEHYPLLEEFSDNLLEFAKTDNAPYDAIHSHYWLSGRVAETLQQHWSVPIIQMFHTLGHMKNRIALNGQQMESPVRIEVEQQLMNTAQVLVAATPAERIQLMWLYGADMKKIRVVSPGVDLDHFHPVDQKHARQEINFPLNEKLLLFVGRIEPLKGIETLLRAIAQLRENAPHAIDGLSVIIIGGDTDEKHVASTEMGRLNALQKELGLDEMVTFFGARDHETLQYYYAASEAVVVPSHYESFGMVALEAMACGTPVIASEVGGLAYLIEDGITGFHVPDRAPDELGGKIKLILENAALRQEMSAAAARAATDYSWSRVARDILAVYRDTIDRYI